ncbi:MAG: hypothetical protein JNJ43_04770 [Anaerolineales bacterium]|nr:hypothetical protein [Anaerolineales bacterium]
MTSFITWYILLTILGWLTFPLTYFLFPKLSDRGYTLARTAGLLIWGYAFWLLASFSIAQNDIGGILFALAILISLSTYLLITNYQLLITFIKDNKSLIITTEILFLIAFAFLAFLRAANSELQSTEKPMELMFINSIMRSETFPPQDVWLSGYAISYYYFGYVMTAMLAKLSGINGSTAHNLMTSLIFALAAIGSYGILYNLLTRTDRRPQTTDDEKINRPPSAVRRLSLLAPLFLLLVSNFETLLEVLHRRGIFWTRDANGTFTSSFWTWLDMKELSQPPIEPLGFIPDRYLWWWRASRVIQDYDIAGGFREVIDEFPFFSFLLGDLHPHVLAIPFGLLAISVALNIFLGGWRGKIEAYGVQLHLNLTGFFFSALVLGGLAFLNTWDILVGAALICSAYVFSRVDEDGWNWKRLEDLFILALPLGIFSLLLYFPFYLGFSSQAGGLLPNFMYPTRGIHLWVMWGTLLIPIFSYLIYLYGVQKLASVPDGKPSDSISPNWKLGIYLGIGFTLFLFALTFLIGWIGSIVERDFVNFQLASFNMTASQFIAATSLRRLTYIGSLITLLAVFIPTLSFLFYKTTDHRPQTVRRPPSAVIFSLLLLTLGTILILAPEFVYLRDQFGYRINTVFKFYYQAWILWSIVAAFGVSILLQNLEKISNIIFRIVIGIVIFCGLLYPIFGVLTKTNNFNPPFGYSLNDFDRVKRENPEEAAAVEFLLTVPHGVIAEAIGDGYSGYGRISMLTGLQTVLGWPGHEAQWRGSFEPQGSRRDDIQKLYTTSRWEEAQAIIAKYNIRYIYIGVLERASMPINEEKFYVYLTPIFQQGNTVIFEVPK